MDDFINSGYSYIAHNIIIIYLHFIHIYNHVHIYMFTYAFSSDTFVFMTWGEELCTNFDKISYTLRAHVVLYDSGTLSSFISQKQEVKTTEGNALERVFEPDKEEIIIEHCYTRRSIIRTLRKIISNIMRRRKMCRNMWIYEGGTQIFRNFNLLHKRDIVQGSATRYSEPTIFWTSLPSDTALRTSCQFFWQFYQVSASVFGDSFKNWIGWS
jgi:hypothetical protein